VDRGVRASLDGASALAANGRAAARLVDGTSGYAAGAVAVRTPFDGASALATTRGPPSGLIDAVPARDRSSVNSL
jgi:hypothetical protein